MVAGHHLCVRVALSALPPPRKTMTSEQQIHVDTCRHMWMHTDICRSMQTYADACRHMWIQWFPFKAECFIREAS